MSESPGRFVEQRAPMLFALDASRAYGERVAMHLGLALSAHEEREFDDGEHKARPLVSVRGRDVYVIYSLYSDSSRSVNDKLCRLLFFIGAVKDAGAARVTAVVPYLAYARKDRKSKSRDPVTTRYVAGLFEAVGTDVVLTIDVHNPAAYENAFRCRAEHLEANSLLAAEVAAASPDKEIVVVSPDAGGIKRAERFRNRIGQLLGRPAGAAFAEKHRSDDVVSGNMLVGEVNGRQAIIVDDLIASGTTLMRTARACKERGASSVWAVATHGLFVGEAGTVLADPALDRIVVIDTVPPFRLDQNGVGRKTTILDSTPLFAEAIRRLHSDGSLTELTAS